MYYPAYRNTKPEYIEYEYDAYYNARVNSSWRSNPLPILVGLGLILMGIFSIVWSATDIGTGGLVNPARFNPNFKSIPALRDLDNFSLAASWQVNSIWPTSGKGIWVGLLMIATGILAIASKLDGSQVSVHVFNILSWLTLLFSLYLILSAVLSIQAYPYNLINPGTREQKIEVAMNSLLVASGIISFVLSLVGAVASCVSLDYCTKGQGV
jgi:uncharacterized membrane protein HdeD (DUF308 family)